jgi:hypothetical protein
MEKCNVKIKGHMINSYVLINIGLFVFCIHYHGRVTTFRMLPVLQAYHPPPEVPAPLGWSVQRVQLAQLVQLASP